MSPTKETQAHTTVEVAESSNKRPPPPATASRRRVRCAATTAASGLPCRLYPREGSEFCYNHDPALAAARSQAGATAVALSRGGSGPRTMKGPDDVEAWLVELWRDIRRVRAQGADPDNIKSLIGLYKQVVAILKGPAKSKAKAAEVEEEVDPDLAFTFGGKSRAKPKEPTTPDEVDAERVRDPGPRPTRKRSTPEGRRGDHSRQRRRDPKRKGAGSGL